MLIITKTINVNINNSNVITNLNFVALSIDGSVYHLFEVPVCFVRYSNQLCEMPVCFVRYSNQLL